MIDLCKCGDGAYLNAKILRFIGQPLSLKYMSLIYNLVNYYFINCLSFLDSRHWKHLVLWLTSIPSSEVYDLFSKQRPICGPKKWGHLLSQNSPYCHMTEVRPIIYDTLSSGNGDLPRDGHKTNRNLSKYPYRGFLARVRRKCTLPSLSGNKAMPV